MAHREGITTHAHDWTMIKASGLIENQRVVTIAASMPVEEACDVLIQNNISSAPVYDDTAPAEENNGNAIVHAPSYVGMFDYGDLIAYILLVLHKAEQTSTFEIRDIVQRAIKGQAVPVKLASDLSRKNPFYSILPEATLLSAVEEFACGTHRVCVLEPNGAIKGILSQSTVVRYLYENRQQFPEIEGLLSKTIRQLHLEKTGVIGVGAESSVLDALSQMSHHGISSVAVIGNGGVVLGNISMTDHVMKSYRHQLLWNTCFQFVGVVRTQQGIIDGQDRLPVFDVRPDTTLGFTIAKLLATKAHRIWVTDERERAISVVSLTDVVRIFASTAGVEITQRRGSLARPT
ncbi:cell separation during budding [Apophysomyces sp. BC1034]|nr:cell separation during budding [Apophysomyces sp. BC1015]KAG0180359.1 cell separation during budding [Apophysomyces sp. BC1021]KAG0190914.1 cell separation during budding [Apophysomyces sp. BC1034]